MFFYFALAAGIAFILYIIHNLMPAAHKNGGSIELFCGDADDEKDAIARAAREAEENMKYTKVYTDPGKQILVLFGSEYGFSGEVAKKLFDSLLKIDGVQPRLVNMKDFNGMCDFSKEQLALIVTSTTGDGVPPTDAREFVEAFLKKKKSDLDLTSLRYSVLALGDNNYPHFCRTGRSMDDAMKALGATSIAPRVDVDQEDWDAINGWFESVLGQVPSLAIEERVDYITERNDAVSNEKHNRSKPYWSKVIVKYEVCKSQPASNEKKRNYEEEREVVHLEFELPEESGLSFTSGDALGVYPSNNPSEVDAFLLALIGETESHEKSKEKTEESVTAKVNKVAAIPVQLPKSCYEDTSLPEGRPKEMPLREALMRYFDLKSVKPELLTTLGKMLEEEEFVKFEEKQFLKKLLANGGTSLKENKELREFLQPREVMDVLEAFPYFFAHANTGSIVGDIIANLKVLQPRYYSISSSPVVEKDKATVTAAVVRYETLDRPRTGVATTFMADRIEVGEKCPIFISRNPDFRLPTDPNTPIIMIGPGTGIAPFRAFIQERLQSATGATNLLYFGCRNRDVDFLYKDEFEALAAQEKIVLRTAFSRDQKEKIYVQHRLLEDAALVWDLLEKGAHVYVCGDATRMAGDVHNAFVQILQKHGNRSEEEAKAFMENLAEQKRYERDVWVT